MVYSMRGPELVPQTVGDASGAGIDAKAREIAVDVFEAAEQQLARVAVLPHVDDLREVDDDKLIVPVEHIVGLQIAVDMVTREQELHIIDKLLKERCCLFGRDVHFSQHRRRPHTAFALYRTRARSTDWL